MAWECGHGPDDGCAVLGVAETQEGIMAQAVSDPEDIGVADDPGLELELQEGRGDLVARQSALPHEELGVVAKDRAGAGLGTQTARVEQEASEGAEALEVGVIGQGAVDAAVHAAAHEERGTIIKTPPPG